MNSNQESSNKPLSQTRKLSDIIEELSEQGLNLDKPGTKPLWGASKLGLKQVVRFDLPDINASHSFHMEDMDCVRIGRYVLGGDDMPEINLGQYPVASQGISRRHALVCREQRMLTVRDLNSTNGTYLNGQRLIPMEVRVLRDGDEVTLGYLKMRVYFA